MSQKFAEVEDSVNSMEAELMNDEDSFRKHVVGFHLGRLQQQFLEIHALFREIE